MKLILGDCLEELRKIESESVDCIVSDPPYNIGKADWDNIPDYINWLGQHIKECERVLKDNGSFYIFHNDFLSLVNIQNWISANTDLIFKQLIVWNKINEGFKNIGFAQHRLSIESMRNYYGGFTEYCLFYTFQDETGLEVITDRYIKPQNPFSAYLREEFKRAGVTNKEIAHLFPSKTGGLTGCVSNWLNGDNVITEEQYLKIRGYLNGEYLRKEYEYLRKEYEYLRKEYEYLRKEYEDQRYTFNTTRTTEDLRGNSNVWLYPPAPNIGHITPKSVSLLENILAHSSNENSIILDPFMGSGTTGVACKNLGRDFIGIELNPEYFKIAKERIGV